MAWQYTSGTALHTADFLTQLNTFMVSTLGWTLHDDLSGGSPPMRVYFSDGEDGNQQIYVRIWDSTTVDRIGGTVMRYWDNVSHTAYTEIGTYAATRQIIVTDDDAPFPYWLYGDKNTVYAVTKVASVYYCVVWGLYDPVYSSAFTTTVNAETAGTNVQIEVVNGALFTAGKKYSIVNCNNATGNPELVTVSAVNGNVLTATLANDHAAGAMIGECPLRTTINYNYTGYNFGGSYCFGPTGSPVVTNPVDVSSMYNPSPDGWQGVRWLVPNFLYYSSTYIFGAFRNLYRTSVSGIASEDTITADGVVYKFFNCYSSKGIAILQG